ncbi:MAG TPA: peptidoglycan DD-metalloendopeptidase family protein [Candidatus Moranbacteria bacterium]|nr:peptidoglycan DD-metalloendopeptidase family protein [Candidatus Moranbacteria bacterium]
MEIRQRQTLRTQKSYLKRKLLTGLFFLVIIFFLFKGFVWLKNILGKNDISKNEIVKTTEKNPEEILEKNSDRVEEYKISEGDIPAEVFESNGKFNANDVEALLFSSKDVYDFTRIKAGQKLRFYFGQEEKAKRVEYDKNTEALIVIERNGSEFSAREEKISYETSQEIAHGNIENFFYVDAMDAGLSESTVLEVGDIFSFDIDFATEIQVGDEFTIIYEKRTRDGKEAPDGKILGAKFINSGVAYYAYYFENDGKSGYYDADGKLLERQFLKAPLSYRHISSGFTGARMHPITRKVSAHYQIDYAAPAGTPVVASANGNLISANWEGGWGNIVRLSHDNGYTTHYGHLSAFAKNLRSSGRISRGQIIGYVGSTGWSTGPHLDYGIKLNGVPVNPLKMDLPKGNPLNEEQMKIFEETKKQYADSLK